ncbi:hypothetical protein ABTZ98_12860 [Streptomyces bacillaris]
MTANLHRRRARLLVPAAKLEGVADVPPDRTATARADTCEAAGVKAFPRVAQAERG